MTGQDLPGGTTFAPADTDDRPPRGGVAAPLAAWAFGFLFLRTFAVSGYEWETAFAVSTTLGVKDGLSMLFGSFLAEHLVVALLLVFVVPLLIGRYLWSPDGRRPTVVLSVALGLATLVALTSSFGTWWVPLATSAVLALFALLRRLAPEHRVRRMSTVAIARVGWVAAAGVLVVAVAVQTPWVPQEEIETTDGTIDGYVLSVDPGYLNVLTTDHEFVILISGDVISRS